MSLNMLKQIFNPEDILKSFETLQPLKSTVIDTLFTQKENHASPFMSYSEVEELLHSVPVVRRDGAPVPLQNTDLNVEFFAPLPIKPFINVTAADLNDLRALMGNQAAVNAWRTKKIDQLRKAARITTEGMASVVATTGKISWVLQLDNGRAGVYEVDFGQIPAAADLTPITNTSKTSDVYSALIEMETQINMNGYGGKITFFAGRKVFLTLVDIVENRTSYTNNNSVTAKLDAGKIIIGGYEIVSMTETYPAPNKQWVSKLNSKTLLAVAADIPGYVYYCALDSISANNQPLPMHIVPVVNDDDSGIKLIAQSKPVPMRPSKASCIWARAVA